jgi:hypothetical protein
MPYFFILPAYLVLLFGLTGLAVAARFMPRFRPFSGCIFGGAAGSLIGFLLFNALVIVLGVAPAWLAEKFTFPDWLQTASKYFVAAALLIGPFIGSAIGVLLGFAAGFFVVLRRRRRAV